MRYSPLGNAPEFLDPDRPDAVRLEVADAAGLGERVLARIGFPVEEARIITDQLIDNRPVPRPGGPATRAGHRGFAGRSRWARRAVSRGIAWILPLDPAKSWPLAVPQSCEKRYNSTS